MRERGNDAVADAVERVSNMVRLISVRQKNPLGLGHAILCAREAVGDEPFAVMVEGQEFRIDYEPAESTTAIYGGNSNWRGPVWINVNAVLCYTLAAAGRRGEALAIARALTLMLARDIAKCGGMHECYCPDTGEPLSTESINFLSWNAMAATLHDNLLAGVDPFAPILN